MKKRLTITLSEDTLAKIDRLIDKVKIRNRSHAIEYLVKKSLVPGVGTAVLLAGGEHKGSDCPLLRSIGKEQLIFIILEHLKSFGIKDAVICAGRWNKEIKDIIGNGKRVGMKVGYLKENKDLGTAGVIRKAGGLLGGEPFLVMHGDVLTDINIEDFIAFHEGEGSMATIAVKPRMYEKKYGKVILEGNRITDFISEDSEKGISIVNTGVYLFEPQVLSLLPKKTPSSLEKDLFPMLVEMGELSAYLFQGIWFDTSEKKDRQIAIKRWKKMAERG